jgi:hypothetical protein
VATLITEIIETLRYVDVDGTLAALSELYLDDPVSSVRSRVMKAVEELARYDLNVWRQVGPAVQMQLSTTIDRFGATERSANRDVFIAVWREFLKSELRGVSWSADAATLSSGAVPASSELTRIRDQAIGGLCAFFDEAVSEPQQREILQALWEATRLPTQATYSNEMVELDPENETVG